MKNFSRSYEAPDLEESETVTLTLDCGEYGKIECLTYWFDDEMQTDIAISAPVSKIAPVFYTEFAHDFLHDYRGDKEETELNTEIAFSAFIEEFSPEELAA